MSVGAAGGKRGRAAPEMNVTPLVDVVLVLLIIFMVITPLLAKQFWLALPDKKEQNEPASPSDKEPVVVTVSKTGVIRINRDEVADDAFAARLTRVLAASGDRTIFFDAHDEAPFERASRALDLARGAGATTIAVATDPIVKD
jgi:biopolymer transport protein ExbD/biopolymer transport protein TolR